MIGNGVDMYDLIPELTETSEELYFTHKKFWVGVIEGKYPSPPIPRKRTKCFSAVPVFKYFDQLIFSMTARSLTGELKKDFYIIPENELMFVQ